MRGRGALNVFVDSCERYPIRFPEWTRVEGKLRRVEVVRKSLVRVGGDYALEDRVVGVERKGRPMEVYLCTVGPRRAAFEAQLAKLEKNYQRGVVLVDSTPFEILNTNYARELARLGIPGPTPGRGDGVLRTLVHMVVGRGMGLVWLGRVDSEAREYAVGEVVLAILTAPVTAPIKEKDDAAQEGK